MTRAAGGGQGTDEGMEYVQPGGSGEGEAGQCHPTFSWEALVPTSQQVLESRVPTLWSPQEVVSSSLQGPVASHTLGAEAIPALLLPLTVPSYILLLTPSGHLGKPNAAPHGEEAVEIPPQGPPN